MKLTRRESALAMMSQAPLSHDIVVPPARKVDPNAPKEWKLQAACIREVRSRMRLDKNLQYEVNLIEGLRDPKRANIVKMMGAQRGPNDLTLYYRIELSIEAQQAVTHIYIQRTHRVEFKLPGKHLTPEQRAWFDYHESCGVPCSRVDNVKEFCRILDSFCGA